ncbi:MAG: hypothetical protein ACLQQ4_01655 [Bacteroidia bacterium]
MAKNKKDEEHKAKNLFSFFIEKNIIMPQNYRDTNSLHIGVEEEGNFNANSEDIVLVAHLTGNIFEATVGQQTMLAILLTDEDAAIVLQGLVEQEDYENAAKIRDYENIFVYTYNRRDLLAIFGKEQ